jgi:hypothetical protein
MSQVKELILYSTENLPKANRLKIKISGIRLPIETYVKENNLEASSST